MALGFSMALEGVALRVLQRPWNPNAPWAKWAAGLNLSPDDLGWLLVILGCFWLGAVAGTWLRLAWCRRLYRPLAILSLVFLWPGTLLGGLVLLLDLPVGGKAGSKKEGRDGQR
jgi:hypothetical protein